MLTIGQLAAFAGVTPRAVRHYHARGLLPEPERDASGYRRYGAQAVVDLIRIKTLADAGVPLARVNELLRADPDDFAAAVDDIDRDMATKIIELEQHRKKVAELASSDGLAVPDDVAAYLAELRAIGMEEQTVTIERDSWILLAAHAPDRVPVWIQMKRDSLADPKYRQLYLLLGETYRWAPDDPRLPGVADELAAIIDAEMTELGEAAEEIIAEPLATLLDAQLTDSSPTWQRLAELIQARGFEGWTNIRRVRRD